MKKISKSYKNKNHEYESNRKQQETMCTPNSFQINHQQQASGKDMHENAHIQAVAIK